MEEHVGLWWHRWVTRAADRRHPDAAVTLAETTRAVTLLLRAAGGDAALRIAPAGLAKAGGPRSWLQRVAGTGTRTERAQLDEQALALPPVLAVFAERELNRDLYLWLAALAAVYEPGGDWIAGHRAATARVLRALPGLRARYARLVDAHLAQRPAPAALRGVAAAHEAAVQAALRGDDHATVAVRPHDVAPLPLWLEPVGDAAAGAAARDDRNDDGHGERRDATPGSATRRRAERVVHAPSRHAIVLPSRSESLPSWAEFVRVDRATDDEPDPHALAAADDMERLTVTPGGRTAASRVKFDLDLPSASADDHPLGPGRKLPEWDWRARRLQPDHCAVQTLVAASPPAYRPPPALRATARRVRRRFEVLRAAPQWQRGCTSGDAIDLDAWVRHRVTTSDTVVSAAPAVYRQRTRGARSLATLLLADLSLSTDAYADSSARIVDVIREALYVFGEALAATGDAFEMLGFSSVRRHNVRLQHLKGFDEPWNAAVQARVGSIRPGYYTRMGAALREATLRLAARPERQRLLLVLTDGKPNDLDVYEGRYGLEDTRHAVQAARDAGLTPFCVTIDETAHAYLPHLFGSRGWALVRRPRELPSRLARVYATLAR
jgi:nitric oxide reductase NorD protein